MERTISGMVGKGSVNHNTRAFSAKNVDKERSRDNVEFCHEDIKAVYHELFDEALERYNAKQKRSDRKIENYYEKIRQGKQEKLFYEVIFQIGNRDDMNARSEEGQLAKQILIDFMTDFQSRNPNLHVFSAHLHMDEETPHIHIDFVPVITGSKRGLDTRVSLKGALAEQGFEGGTRGATEWNQWIESEKKELAAVMERYGVEWLQKGTHNKHLSVLDYEKQERAKEVAELDSQLAQSERALQTVSKSIPLAFTGLAVALGSRCGMLNIGAEGQLHAGAMAATLTGLTLSFLPAPILLVVSIAAGIAAGMLVGSVPGIFKAKFQTNEVIVAIMLNYVCTLFTSWLVNGPFKVPGSTAQTEMLPENIWFARLLPKTQLTWALFLLLATAVLMYIFLWKTSVGYQLRAVGANASAAKTAGIPVNFYLIMAMTLSGGIAALAGVTEIFGKYHRFIEGFSPSFGFTGIAVAILGKNHPAGVLLTSLLFGVLEMGSLRMSRETAVSTNMVTVIQSLVILFVAAPELIRWSRKRRG